MSSSTHIIVCGRDATNKTTHPLAVDSSGKLECSIDALELSAETINLSTDGLETLVGTTNSNLEHISGDLDTCNTTLTTIKTSAQNSETALNNISVNMYNGAQQAKCMGIGDDGANKQMKTDNSGNVSAYLVSDVVMKPSNITNGDHASFSGSSVASMLRGRTNINDNTTGVFLNCNNTGELKISSTKTTGEWLATSTSIGDDAYSAALDCSAFKSVRLMGKWVGGSLASMSILGSQSSSGTYYSLSSVNGLSQTGIDIGGSTEYHLSAYIENVPNFIKLYNNSGGSKTLEVDYVGISN